MGLSNEVGLKHTILVVDDEPLARLTTADMLRLGGFNVLEAGNGAQALELLADGYHVAAVVTDVRMPVLDGCGSVARYPRGTSADSGRLRLRRHFRCCRAARGDALPPQTA